MREKRALLALAISALLSGPALAEPVGIFDDHKDLGNPPTDPLPGSATFAGGTYTVVGGGNDWWDGGEFGHVVYKAVTGDFRLETNVRVVATVNEDLNDWFKAGLFVRNDVDNGTGNLREVNAIAAMVDPFRTDGTRQALQWRQNSGDVDGNNMGNAENGGPQPNDGTLKLVLQRRAYAGKFLVEGFVDRGSGFVKLGQVVMPNLANNAFAGLFVTSHDGGVTETAEFTNVAFVAPSSENPFALASMPAQRAVTTSPGAGAAGQWSVLEVTGNGDINDLPALIASVDGGAGARQSYNASVINIWDSDGRGNFQADARFKSDSDQVNDGTDTVNHISVVARTGVVIPTAGIYTFGVNSDDGFELSIDGKIVAEYTSGRGSSDTLGSVELTPGVHDLRLLYWEGGGGSSVEVFAAAGLFGSFDSSMRLVGDTANGGLAITAVPEPASMALLGLGALALLGRRRRA